ncbi:MAG: transposase [Coraliomargarita sp.]|nr:transposase [Coraliomargarita sp.]
MRQRRIKVGGREAVYHCMTRTVNGERLFGDREKERLRRMIWQVADFSGVQVLTFCVMSNHFHVLVRVPDQVRISDAELMRRYRLLYPKPTKYQEASARVMAGELAAGGDEADAIRRRWLARMGDVSEFMKTLKQRFGIWFNRTHRRYGTLWADRFKSVLVEGEGNPLQTMAAYIDLNPVRAGIVEDPKDYRFCGYAEAVSGEAGAREGLRRVWADHASAISSNRAATMARVLQAHRVLIFGKGSSPWTHQGCIIDRKKAIKVLEEQDGELSKATMLRCRVRYFTDGAILGSAEFVRGFTGALQMEQIERKRPPKVSELRGAAWGDLAVIRGLRRQVFG